MSKKPSYLIQGYYPPKQGTQQAPKDARMQQYQGAAQTPPQNMPNPYAGAGNAANYAQEPAQALQGNYTAPAQETPRKPARKPGNGKDKVLLISAIISTAWLVISIFVIRGALNSAPTGGNEFEAIGYQIGAAIALRMLAPFLVLTLAGTVFNWLAWAGSKKGFALTAGILFAVSLLFGYSYVIGIIPCVVLAFVGYSRLKRRDTK